MLDLHPYTLLVLIFVVLVTKQVVSAIGRLQIDDFAWNWYLQIAGRVENSAAAKLQTQKAEHRSTLRESNKISAQDEYAKWTKLNRKVDKLEADIKTANLGLQAQKASVAKAVGIALMLVTTVPLWVSRIWFRKTVLFYLPVGALPRPVELLLTFPFLLHSGGIRLTAWIFCTGKVISNVIFMVKFVLSAAPEAPEAETEADKTETKTGIKETIKPVQAQ